MARLRWDELTYAELSSALSSGVDSVVLPVGTVEPHGAHLPLGADTIIAEVIGELVAERVGAFLLPALPYGVTGSLHGYPGSIRVPPDVLEALVLSVLESVSLHGVRYALLLNGHGGNTQSLESAARQAWLRFKLATMVVDWWVVARERGLTRQLLGKEGGHAATDETAVMLAVRPELVKRELYSDETVYVYSPGVKAYPLPGTVINYTAEEGAVIFPSEGESRRFLEAVASAIAELFSDFRRRVERELRRRA